MAALSNESQKPEQLRLLRAVAWFVSRHVLPFDMVQHTLTHEFTPRFQGMLASQAPRDSGAWAVDEAVLEACVCLLTHLLGASSVSNPNHPNNPAQSQAAHVGPVLLDAGPDAGVIRAWVAASPVVQCLASLAEDARTSSRLRFMTQDLLANFLFE